MAVELLFRSKNKALAELAIDVLHNEHPMTLRQLYYRLVSSGALKNRQAEYVRLGTLMTRVREADNVPRNWIVDHVRATLKPSSWSGLANYADTVRRCYRKDYWASLDHYVAIFVEKDAIAGTIQPVTQEFDVSLHVCRGYASVSFAGEIAADWSRIEKPIFAYYLGDFDPSGFDIERDLREKLERYSGRSVVPTDEVDEDTFCWARLGVVADDFTEHNLIALPVKHKDRRAVGFVARHGERCAEVDALPPSELRRRVKDAIQRHIDDWSWGRLKVIEAAEQSSLAVVLRGWDAATQSTLGSDDDTDDPEGDE